MTTFSNARGGALGAGLTRLRLGDDVFRIPAVADRAACAGFVIIQRGNFPPLPRPRSPLRPAACRTG